MKPDYSKYCGHYGGLVPDNPIRMWPKCQRKRRVTISIIMFYGIGQHYWVSLKEDGNPVWNTEEGYWFEPWSDRDPEGRGKRLDTQKFNTLIEAKRWIAETLAKEFPKKTHTYYNSNTYKRWYYKEGD